MSPEERQLLTGLLDRIRGAAATPRDPEAEALISDAVRTMPFAPYLLAQAVIVQDQALQAANGKIQDLEARLRAAEPPQQAAGTGGFLGGLGSLFGGGGGNPPVRQVPSAPGPWGQQPSYAPPAPPSGGPFGGPSAGPWGAAPGGGGIMGGGGGGSFLQGALGTAAGVAGGVLLADSIRGLFGGHYNPMGIGTGFAPGLGGGLGGGETVINNFYDNGGAAPDNVDYGAYSDTPQNDTYDASYDDSGNGLGSDDGGSFDV